MASLFSSSFRSKITLRTLLSSSSVLSGHNSRGVSSPGKFSLERHSSSSWSQSQNLVKYRLQNVQLQLLNRFHKTSTCSSSSMICGSCSHSYTKDSENAEFVSLVSCPKCGALQSLAEKELPDYFSILGHDKSFRVNLQSIADKTKQLQKKFHPDLYSQRSSEQQALSQEYSSMVNKALWTLADPITRGRYMLTLAGSSSEDPDNDLERTMMLDPEFLEDVMELNERLEEISSEQDWKEFRSQNADTMKEIHIELEEAFQKDDITEARRLLGRLKFYDTLQHKLKDLQSKIGIIE